MAGGAHFSTTLPLTLPLSTWSPLPGPPEGMLLRHQTCLAEKTRSLSLQGLRPIVACLRYLLHWLSTPPGPRDSPRHTAGSFTKGVRRIRHRHKLHMQMHTCFYKYHTYHRRSSKLLNLSEVETSNYSASYICPSNPRLGMGHSSNRVKQNAYPDTPSSSQSIKDGWDK